jgi:hypothetical protein
MDKLTWTSTTPSEPGWYWWRLGVGDVWPIILEVTREEAGGLEADGQPAANLSGTGGEFAGPLIPPEDER